MQTAIVKNLPVMLEQLGSEGHPVLKPLLYQIVTSAWTIIDKRS